MATTVTFYNFSKKSNSTAVPSSGGTALDCFIKEATSTYNPTFIINSSSWPDYTYVYWNPYYYFVNDIVCVNEDLYEVSCSIDPLASWRNEILNSSQFVNRSASSYNIWMKDVEVSNEQKVVNTNYASTNIPYFGPGCYLLRTTSGDAVDATGVLTYVLSESQMNEALDWLFTSGDVLDSAWDTVVKTVFNPFQYVVSLKYTPIEPENIAKNFSPGGGSRVAFGWWTHSLPSALQPVHVLSNPSVAFPTPTQPITLNKPAAYYGDFRDYDPDFTEYRLTLLDGSVVTIPSIMMSETIYVSVMCDLFTGKGVIFLDTSNGYYTSFGFDCCCDIQIGQAAADIKEVGNNVVTGMSAAIAKHPAMIGASVMGAITSSLQPIPSLTGTSGSLTMLRNIHSLNVTAIHYGSGAYPTTRYGRMLNASRTLSTLSGFCKCSEASVDCNAPLNIKNQINNMLNTGFYIE